MQRKHLVSVRGCGKKYGCFGEGKDTVDTLYRLQADSFNSALNTGQPAACRPVQGGSGGDQNRSLCRSTSSFSLSLNLLTFFLGCGFGAHGTGSLYFLQSY